MRRFAYAAFLAFMCLWSGCAIADFLAGIKRDPTGKVIAVDGHPIGEGMASLLGLVFPYAGWAGTAATAAIREYRHWQIVKSGGKDDNRDGVPDPEPDQKTGTHGTGTNG